ncbi:MAG: MFS transporter [Bryobacteraceae bacterium]
MRTHTERSTVAAGLISARIDRLPMTRTMWNRVILLSLGGFFEFYDMLFTGYVGPGLVKSGILTPTTPGLFGTTGLASFVAATFLGMFLGTLLFGFLADRLGRKIIFTYALVWYSIATVIMAFQDHAFGLNLWRFIAGIGVGVEMVTIDAYLSELVPRAHRGRAFAYNQVIQFTAVPTIAFLAWLLVPLSPFGFDGWRWVVLGASVGAIFVWWIRRRVPESPRWLAMHGRFEEADAIVSDLEAKVTAEYGAPLSTDLRTQPNEPRGKFAEIWSGQYRSRTIMLIIFNIFQTVGYYGFSNWVPTLLIKQGIALTTSLGYTFLIAISAPFGPLLAASLADRMERKWQIVLAAASVAIGGTIFGSTTIVPLLIIFGVVLTLSNNIMSYAFHAYQAELYPTRIRAMAIGFVYAWSRLSVVFSAFIIAFFLDRFGVAGVFAFISGAMLIVMLAIGVLGPPTKGLALEEISE